MITAIRTTSGDFSVTETKDNELLTGPAIELITELHRQLNDKRTDLLARRIARRAELSAGQVAPLEATEHVRNAEWKVHPLPHDLLERRVELLGSADAGAIINGMNSGAKTYIVDLQNFGPVQDEAVMRCHDTVNGAVRRELDHKDFMGEPMRISPSSQARMCLVPRSLDRGATTVMVDDTPVSATLLDIVLHCYHNLGELLNTQGAALFMIRDVRSHLEARWYNELFNLLEEHFHVSRGSIRVTVMIGHLAAALEMDEILFELQDHSSGLTIDPQAYALDHITLFSSPDRDVLPDRESIGLSAHMLRSLSLSMIGTCHRRKAHAIGAPSFILPPDDEGNAPRGFKEMMQDTEREAIDGHDGTLVAHPGLVNPAMMEFNKSMPKAHQMYYVRKDKITPADLIKRPVGEVTANSLKALVRTALIHGVSERLGVGMAIGIGRIHDRSSKNLALGLLWQWSSCKQGVVSSTGLEVTDDLVKFLVEKEVEKIYGQTNEKARAIAQEVAGQLIGAVLSEEMPGT